MRTTPLALGLLLCLTAAACDQKISTEDAAPTASAVPTPPPAPPPAPKESELSAVDVVKYLPKDCIARVYIDVASLRQHPKVAAQLVRILSSTLSRNAQTKDALQLMNSTLKSGGVQLPDDAVGFAGCVQSADEWISSVMLDVKDVKTGPLELIQETVNATGGPKFAPSESEEGGKLKYLSASDAPGVLSFVDEGILAVASNPAMLAASAKKPGSADAFGAELESVLLAGRFSMGPQNQAKLFLKEVDDGIQAVLDVAMSKEQSAKALADRQKFVNDLKQGLAAQVGEIEEEELKALAAKVQQASVEIDDNHVRATLTISEDDVAGLIASLAQATPASLVKKVDSKLP